MKKLAILISSVLFISFVFPQGITNSVIITDADNNILMIIYDMGTTGGAYAKLIASETVVSKTVQISNDGMGTHLLDVGESGAYCDGSAWIDGSSREYKVNISELGLDDAIRTLEQLNPVTYNYKTNLGDTSVGFIAEDVPELVATNDRKGLSSMDFVAVLTKVTQEQQRVIEGLTKRIENLESN